LLERLLERVRALTPAERQELRARLETWPIPSQATAHDLDKRLLAAGVIDRVPARLEDGAKLGLAQSAEMVGQVRGQGEAVTPFGRAARFMRPPDPCRTIARAPAKPRAGGRG